MTWKIYLLNIFFFRFEILVRMFSLLYNFTISSTGNRQTVYYCSWFRLFHILFSFIPLRFDDNRNQRRYQLSLTTPYAHCTMYRKKFSLYFHLTFSFSAFSDAKQWNTKVVSVSGIKDFQRAFYVRIDYIIYLFFFTHIKNFS